MITQRTKRPNTRSSTPAKTRGEKTAERRAELLDTAKKLFIRHGYTATSTKRIAEAAGVAEGLLFHYFGTKEALLIEIVAQPTSFAGHIASILFDEERDARTLLHSIAAAYGSVTSDEAALVAFVHAEELVNPALRGAIASGTKQVIARMVAMLTLRVRAGELRDDAALEATVVGFFGGFSFFFAQHRDLPSRAWKKRAEAFALAWAEQCWRGIATMRALDSIMSNQEKR